MDYATKCKQLERDLEQMRAARDETEVKNLKLRQIAKKFKDEKEKAEQAAAALQREVDSIRAAKEIAETRAMQAEAFLNAETIDMTTIESRMKSTERALGDSRIAEATAKAATAEKERMLFEEKMKATKAIAELMKELAEKKLMIRRRDEDLVKWRNWKDKIQASISRPTPRIRVAGETLNEGEMAAQGAHHAEEHAPHDSGEPSRKRKKQPAKKFAFVEDYSRPLGKDYRKERTTYASASARAPAEGRYSFEIEGLPRPDASYSPQDHMALFDSRGDYRMSANGGGQNGGVKYETVDDEFSLDYEGRHSGPLGGQEWRNDEFETAYELDSAGVSTATPSVNRVGKKRPPHRKRKFKKSKDANLCTKKELIERIIMLSEFLHAYPVTAEEFAGLTIEQRAVIPARLPLRDGVGPVEYNNKGAVLANAIKYYEKKLASGVEDEENEEEEEEEEEEDAENEEQEQDDKHQATIVRRSIPGVKGKKSKDANLCNKEELLERIVVLSQFLHQTPVTLEEVEAMTPEQRVAVAKRKFAKGLTTVDKSNKAVTLANAIRHYEKRLADAAAEEAGEKPVQVQLRADNRHIGEAAEAALNYLKAGKHTQQSLEEQLIRCYRAFPSQVTLESLRQQTAEQKTQYIECLLHGRKFQEIQNLQEAIRGIFEILTRDHWKEETPMKEEVKPEKME